MIYLRNNKIKDTYLGDKKLSKIYLGDKLVWPQEKKFDANGHDYVEIAGIKWATMNVGANKVTDYGLYFQWGDTQGYTQQDIKDGKKKFASDWSDYKWYESGDEYNPTFTKYTTTGATLELDDDAAHANMGGSWHIPSPEQIKELIDNTISIWTTQDGVNGRLFTSTKDTSKSIFIPAAGYAWGGSVRGRGSDGYVWSSMLSSSYVSYGQYLNFNSGPAYLRNTNRNSGGSVRGVLAEN